MRIFFFVPLLFFSLSLSAAAAGKNSEACWLWAGDQKNVPVRSYLRMKFNVDEPVKKAYFYSWWDKKGKFHVNGKTVTPVPWKPVWNFRGHVKGKGVDIKPLLRKGENVIAVELERFQNLRYCFGMILRGEIEFASGKKISLVSSAKNFKASGECVPGWKMPNFNDKAWSNARELGDVNMTPWSTYGNVAQAFCSAEELAALRARCMTSFPEKQLASEPVHPRVRIRYSNHIPGVEVNGKVIPYVSLTHCDTQALHPARDKMIASARKAGVPILVIDISSAKFQVLDGSGNYDLSEVDLAVRRMLSIHPDAYINLYFKGDPLEWWMKKNPDELIGYAHKVPAKKNWGFYDNTRSTSFASKKYLAEVAKNLKTIADFCLKQPWGKRIIIVSTGYGTSGDGMPPGCHAMPDTGKRMTERFRNFLAKRYKTDRALQKSWNDPAVTIATACVPDEPQRRGNGQYLRDPADPRDRRLIDYYTCYHETFTDYIIGFGKAAKEAFPGRLFSAYYGYMILGYTPEGNTANFERAIKSPYVDIMNSTTVGYNLGDGLHRSLHSIFHRYNKLTSIEGDIRSHLGLLGHDAEKAWTCKTPETTRHAASKLAGNALFYGAGFHIVDFGVNRKWADCPEILEPVAAGIREWKRLYDAPPRKSADVAVIIDPVQVWKQGFPQYGRASGVAWALMQHPLKTLNFSGFTNDMMALEDYLASTHPYKAVVFLNAFEYTPAQRKALLKKIRRPGITAIWHYAPGLVSPEGYSNAAMKEMTGLSLKYKTGDFLFAANRDEGKKVFDNLCPDGSFEEGMKNWRLVHVKKNEADRVAAFLPETKAFHGKKYLSFEVKKKLSTYSALIRDIPVPSGKVLPDTLSIAYQGSARSSVLVYYRTPDGKRSVTKDQLFLTPGKKWQNFSMPLNVPTETDRITLEIRLADGGTYHFDSCRLENRPGAIALAGRKNFRFGPRVYSDDPQAEILMRYTDDNTPAMVRKKLSDGSTAVFSGIPVNSPRVWAELLSAAGCHAYTRAGFFVRSNSKMVQLTTIRNGNLGPEDDILRENLRSPAEITLTLPGNFTRATDVFTNEVFPVRNRKIQLKSDHPKVWLFNLK